jgi:hypothetical protein
MPHRNSLHNLVDTLPEAALESIERVLQHHQKWPPQPPIDVRVVSLVQRRGHLLQVLHRLFERLGRENVNRIPLHQAGLENKLLDRLDSVRFHDGYALVGGAEHQRTGHKSDSEFLRKLRYFREHL